MKLFKKLVFLFFIFVLVLLFNFNLGGGQAILSASSDEEFLPDTVLVKFVPGTPAEVKNEIHQQNNGRIEKKISSIEVEVVKVPFGQVKNAISRYRQNPNILYAEPDFMAQATAVTNDTELSNQWGMFKIEAAKSDGASAWDITTGNTEVKIAILDTGIEMTHQDLAAKIVLSWNFTSSATVNDIHGHGTHVAGIAAAVTNNNLGVAGAGYDSSLMNGKVLGDNGSGYYSWVANGIVWATDNGAKVINMSLGGSSASQILLDAVNYAWNNGVVVVAAAGNNGNSSFFYPAAYTNCLAVAATDNQDQKASWSTWGSWVDVAAPGVSIYSTYKNNIYTSFSGTSMASPFTAGLAGLVWATNLCSTNTCVRAQIENNADIIQGTGTYWTYGRLNAFRAVGGTTPPPTYYPLTVSKDGDGSGTVTSNPSGINCGTACSAEFREGTSVTLAASPNSNSAFVGWSGACTGTGLTCVVIMNSPLTVTATFNLLPPLPNLNVSVTTDKAEYRHSERAQITVTVTDNANPANAINNANVNLTITTANGNRFTNSGLTNSNGIVRFTFRVNTGRDGVGTYRADATAAKSGYNSGSGSITFLVRR